MNPLFIFGLLDGLGLGERILVGAVFVLFVLYLWRMRQMAGKSANTASTLWLVGISVSAAAALAIFLGWVDPFPDRFLTDVMSWVRATFEFVFGPVDDFIRGLIPWL
jgi:hypothetical protein